MAFPLPAGVPGGVTPPLLTDWQFSYNGLTFGAGTNFGVLTVKGLAMADIRQGDIVLPRDQGYEPGLDSYGGRTPEFDLWLTGIGGLQANQVMLSRAIGLGYATESPLWFKLPTLPLMCVMARARKRSMDWDANFAAQAAGKPTVQFFCTDPRIYTASISTTIELGSSGAAGLGFPVGPFPVTFGATTPSEASISNIGTVETRPILVFTGPLTNPWVGNESVEGSPLVQIADPYQTTYTVLDGDQALIDLNVPHRCLYYAGGISSGLAPSSIRDWLTFESEWWQLPPGMASAIQFGSQDASGTDGYVEVWSASGFEL